MPPRTFSGQQQHPRMGTGYLIVLVPVRMGAYCGVIHTRKTMNNNQRILTFLAVAAFALTTLFAPRDLTGSPDHINVLRYAPLFAPPELGPWPKRELASGIFWSWLAIGIIYSALFVMY